MRPLPLTVQTAYHDLLQRHQAVPDLGIPGSIIRVKNKDGQYWVSRQRVGDVVRETRIGPDNEEVRERVSLAKAAQENHKTWLREVSALVASLRSARMLAPDVTTSRTLAAIERTGFFRAGGVLGGTHAFRYYPLMLGVYPPEVSHLQTGDVDLMAPIDMRIAGTSKSLMTLIRETGLAVDTLFGSEAQSPHKHLVEGAVELEILSPVSRTGEPTHKHRGLGEQVQALRFLEFSLKEPTQAVCLYRGGVIVSVPSPERYALHKLLVAERRSGGFTGKSAKDLAQSAWLIDVLARDRPYELWQAWSDLNARGPKWRALAKASLDKIPAAQDSLREMVEEFGDMEDHGINV